MSDEIAKMVKMVVVKRVEKIRNMAGDPEAAHYEEKELWGDVLAWAVEGYDVQEAAKEALKTEEIDFPRWYA